MSNRESQLVSTDVQGKVLVATLLVARLRDSETAHQVADHVIGQANEMGSAQIVFDASRVEFIGSVGLLAFLRVRRQLANSRIVLCRLSPTMRQFFEICRLIPSRSSPAAPFQAVDSVEEAVSILNGAA